MEHWLRPAPLRRPFLTTGTLLLAFFAGLGLCAALARLLLGLGAVTNLTNQTPWGLWIAVDVAGGVALAAGGFTSAALCHVMGREEFHPVARPALLTALLGYTFVAVGVAMDIGRWYSIWHPVFMWNGNSALFEVGICVTVYLTVLYCEFIPVVTERFLGRVRLPGPLGRFDGAGEALLRLADRAAARAMPFLIIAGVVLSTLHQSSLGTLMVIAGPKMHPLWQTPILPLLFFLSAVAVGFPMVIFESLLASWAFGLKPEGRLLAKLGRMTAPLLAVYLAFKVGDMMVRETFTSLAALDAPAWAFMAELLVGVVIPLRMLLSEEVLASPPLLFTASSCVVGGVLLNRFNNFVTAYTPPYLLTPYRPAAAEAAVTVGFICLLALLYRAAVLVFPVVSQPDTARVPRSKYAVRA